MRSPPQPSRRECKTDFAAKREETGERSTHDHRAGRARVLPAAYHPELCAVRGEWIFAFGKKGCHLGSRPADHPVHWVRVLGDDGDITPYIILAIAAIIPVGSEHLYHGSDQSAKLQDKNHLIFSSFITLLLVVIVYSIGDRNA